MSSLLLPGAESGQRLRLHAGDFAVEIAIDTRHLEKLYGPRFDRTAVVVSAKKSALEFVEARGLCDEFGLRGLGVLGYAEASVGDGEFLKIGVGVLRRDDAGDYSFVRHWPVAASLPVGLVGGENELSVSHRSPLRHGFAYRLTKRYAVVPEGVLTIAYKLENAGEKPFAFEHYNHNFFSFSGALSDERYTVKPAFGLNEPGNQHWAYRDEALRLAGVAPARGGVYFGIETDYVSVAQNRVILAHQDRGSVEIAGEFPLSRFAVWATASAICPELFFRAQIQPGDTVSWTHTYRFHVSATSSP